MMKNKKGQSAPPLAFLQHISQDDNLVIMPSLFREDFFLAYKDAFMDLFSPS
jgi:hypothetical protein